MSEQLAIQGLEQKHSPYVAHQFEEAEQQKEAATVGMWTFLATEILFFGALLVAYAVYRLRWPEEFRQGSLDLKWYLGGINTAVLLGSSFFMAMAVHAASLGHNAKIIRNLVLTIVLACVFLVIKGTEYYLEWDEGLLPGSSFRHNPPPKSEESAFGRMFTSLEDAMKSETAAPHEEKQRPAQEELFMFFYFVLTGIHATHMIIGIGVMITLVWMTKQGKFSAAYHNPVEITGLYWHFVDTVWVFLFPILYLLRNP
jgi:cytochrome c oxidase subunit 3